MRSSIRLIYVLADRPGLTNGWDTVCKFFVVITENYYYRVTLGQ